MASSPTIIIIGGGLSGLCLSIFIARLVPKATIRIYEVRSPSHPVSSGTINMTPNAIRVLDHAGVYKSLIPHGYSFDSITMANHHLQVLATVPMAGVNEFEYQALRIERSYLHSALLDKAKEYPQIEITNDCKFTSMTESDTGVTVTFANGTTASGDLLIACDGIHSTVRKFFMKNPEDHDPKYMGQVSIGSFISASEIAQYNTANIQYPVMMFGPESDTGGSFIIWPYTRDGDGLTFFTTLKKPDEEADWKAYASDGGKLKSLIGGVLSSPDSPWHDLAKKTIEKSGTERYRFWPFYQHTLPDKFHSEKGRVIMVGDAAHAMPPSGGQGGAMAFEDSESLAYSLAHAYTTCPDGNLGSPEGLEILDKWSDHRVARIKTIQLMNQRMSNMRRGGSGIVGHILFTAKIYFIWLAGLLGLLGQTRRVINDYNSKKEMATLFGDGINSLD
ncbi:hypothetical protein TWF694_010171 [Orbilia ellipsospora]|uniref:FAD-binding domain-containing protein n=1 Tax=Orbilia ellipsospora TaxID=2528407 RepID=A0AAV9XFE0_9PEZI